MGLEFILKVEDSYARKWDRAEKQFGSPGMFPPALKGIDRFLQIVPVDSAKFAIGDEGVLRAESKDIRMYRGETLVGRNARPPQWALDILSNSHEIAIGLVANVMPRSGTAQVSMS